MSRHPWRPTQPRTPPAITSIRSGRNSGGLRQRPSTSIRFEALPSNISPRERCKIATTSEGSVKVVIGTGPSRQGHETSFAQVVGAVLAVPVEVIDVVTGDTDIVSLGGGSHSGRSMRHSATLFAKAAPELIANGQGGGGAPPRHQRRSGYFCRGPVLGTSAQPQFRFSRIGKGGVAARRKRACGHDRQRHARSGLSEWLRGLRGRGRSRNRIGRDRPLFS